MAEGSRRTISMLVCPCLNILKRNQWIRLRILRYNSETTSNYKIHNTTQGFSDARQAIHGSFLFRSIGSNLHERGFIGSTAGARTRW